MKELTIEQKAKAYDEAIERARVWKDKSGMPKDKQGILDDIFPELKELEDERIRKDIATFIFNYKGDIKDRAKWMDYLGVKVSFVEMQGKLKLTDKLEPKFHKGEWVTNGYRNLFQIIKIDIDNEWYYADDGEQVCFDVVHDYYHLWTIQDAKDGDVLATAKNVLLNTKINKNNK